MFWSYWVNQLSTGVLPSGTVAVVAGTVTAWAWMIWSSH